MTIHFRNQVFALGALSLLLTTHCYAQYPTQYPAPGQYQGGRFPGQGRQFPQQSPFQNPGAQAQTQGALPDGVNQVYALEGTNTILAIATPDGYDRIRELIRNIDGDLDIVQTKVVAVDVTTSDLAALGVSARTGAGSVVSGTDGGKLLAALASGRLTGSDVVRLTTRENTPIETLLRVRGSAAGTGGTPVSVIPRVTKDGAVSLEISEPLSAMVTARGGETVVLAAPGTTADAVRLLFLTPGILPSDTRPAR